jgi:hypothetical protein
MKIFRLLVITTILIADMMLTGCISEYSQKEITPVGLSVANKHPETVLIVATGGGKLHVNTGVSNIQDQTLLDAIANSITQSGLFTRAVTVGNADYQLDVLLVNLDQPAGTFTMTGTARIIWKLTRLQDGKEVFQDEIVTEDRETVGDHFVGETRARAAVSGSVRKNIQEAIERISKTQF